MTSPRPDVLLRTVGLALGLLAAGCPPRKSADGVPPPGKGEATGGLAGTGVTPALPPPPRPKLPPPKPTEEEAPFRVEVRMPKPLSATKKPDIPPPPPPPDGQSPAPLQASAHVGQGRLSAEEVRAVIAKNAESFRKCLSGDASVRVSASITTSGAVGEAKSERSTPDDQRLRECVLAVFTKITFPTGWAKAGSQDPTYVVLDLELRVE